MTEENKLVCMKCGNPIVVEDLSKNKYTFADERKKYGEGGPRRYRASCSTVISLHGDTYGRTPEEALTAYAKDQEWGMKQLGKLAAYEEFEQGLKGAAKKIWESI